VCRAQRILLLACAEARVTQAHEQGAPSAFIRFALELNELYGTLEVRTRLLVRVHV
jgi:hypothetical protein